jgi:hypothetical protein
VELEALAHVATIRQMAGYCHRNETRCLAGRLMGHNMKQVGPLTVT